MSEKKILPIIAIIVIIAIVGIILIGGASNNNVMDLTKIDMEVIVADTPFGGALTNAGMSGTSQVGVVKTTFSLMPRESITRVTGLEVKDIEVSFENGEKENWGTYSFNSPKDKYIVNSNYDFSISHQIKDGKSLEDYYTVSHIKGDIVMNTTDATNVVVGHIDNDVTPTHY